MTKIKRETGRSSTGAAPVDPQQLHGVPALNRRGMLLRFMRRRGALGLVSVIACMLLGASVVQADPPLSFHGSTNHNQGVDTGDPISANAGAYHFEVPLLNLGGPLPLVYSLSFRLDQWSSRTLQNQLLRFQASTDIALERLGPMGIEVFLRNGEVLFFSDSGEQWALDTRSPIRYVLKETGADSCHGYYYLMDPARERVYVFEKVPAACTPHYSEDRILQVMDRKGNHLDYAYGSATYPFRPDQVTDGLGRSLSFTYEAGTEKISLVTGSGGRSVGINQNPGADSSTTDAMGRTTIFHYDGQHIISVESPEGNIPFRQTAAFIRLNGKSSDRTTSQTDAYGSTVDLAYDPDVNRVTETRPDGNTVVYEHYHNDGLPKTVTDPTGKTARVGQTANEQPSSITDRMGDTTNITYHAPTGKIASYQDAEGHTTTFTHEPENQTFTNPANGETVTFTFYNLTRIDHADGTHEELAYDPAHNGSILTHTSRSGKTWTFTYNSRGQVLTATNPTGGTITYTYNADATAATRTDPETGATTYQYDEYRRLNRITHPDGTSVQMVYDDNDQMTSLTDERGNTFSYAYDLNGNLTSVTDPKGNPVQYGHDLMDRVTSITGRRGQESTTTYDIMGRRASDTDPNGIAAAYGYDPRGWRSQYTLGGKTWQTGYDDEGVPSSRTTPLGLATAYETNKLGRATRVTDPLGNEVNIARDSRQRITGITDPLGHTTNFAYNGWDLLDSVTVPVAGTAAYQRNDLGLLTGLTDLNGRSWHFAYSNMGRLTEVVDPLANTWGHAYDNRGLLSQMTLPAGGTLAMSYDSAGNLVQRAYSPGPTLDYAYDTDLNRLTGADQIGFAYDEDGNVTSTDNQGTAFTATHDDGGRVQTVSYAGGALTVTYAYDAETGLLTGVQDSLAGATMSFVYDDDMRLVDIDRSSGVNTTLTWDDANRLARIQHGALGDIQYSRDAAGRITRADMTAPLDPASLLAAETGSFAYDTASQVSSTGYAHGQRGRRTADPSRSYTWDGAGRLTAAGGATFSYNGLGDLLSRTEGASSVSYYYNYAVASHPIMAERDGGSGPWLRYYVYTPGGRLLYMMDPQDSNRVYFYHFDNIGSTLFLTDGAGAVTDSYAYSPYGSLLEHDGSNPQPFTFVGELGVRREGASGELYDMRARYHDATTARFISRDPIWPALASAKSLNPYQYAMGNPVSVVDPSGRQALLTEQLQDILREEAASSSSDRQSTSSAGDMSVVEYAANQLVPGYESFNKGDYGKIPGEVLWNLGSKSADALKVGLEVEKALVQEPVDTKGMDWSGSHQQYKNFYGTSPGGQVTAFLMTLASYPSSALDKIFSFAIDAIGTANNFVVTVPEKLASSMAPSQEEVRAAVEAMEEGFIMDIGMFP